jgi:Flp pilus assembly protein TadD
MKQELEDLFADGQLKCVEGDIEAGIKIFSDILADDPSLGKVYQARAIAHLRSGEPKKAVEDIDAALACEPENSRFHYRKGAILVHGESFDEALESLSRAIDLDPAFSPPYLLRGKIYERFGEEELANADIRQAMDLQKEQMEVKGY